MKLTSILFVIAFIGHSYAQTNVISLKSHSGDLSMLQEEADNFGLPDMDITIDTVVLFNSNCLIEIKTMNGSNHYCDTICDHPYLKGLGTNYKQIKQHYPRGVVFIGFKNTPTIDDASEPVRINGTDLVGRMLILSLLLFVFIPVSKK